MSATAISSGGPIAYTLRGTRDPLVLFIHGWCCNRAFWHGQMTAFADRFRVAALDLGGHGGSRRAPGHAWSIEGFGEDVVAVVDALEVESVALIGHSMGGPVAIEAASRLGERCWLVVGVDAFTDAAFYPRLPRETIDARKKIFAADFSDAMERMVRAIVAPGAGPDLIAWIVGEMTKVDSHMALPVLDALLDWDIERRWPLRRGFIETINSGPLALRGDQIALEGLRVHALDSVGHFPMLEAPAAFNTALESVLDRYRGGRE